MTEKQLEETSKDYLIVRNPKEKPYDIFVVNGTSLDRTSAVELTDESENVYTSVAHYIACRKIQLLRLPSEMLEECIKDYVVESPVTMEYSYCEYEDALYAKYSREVAMLPENIWYSWRENYVKLAVEGIMLMLQQHRRLRQDLINTGTKVLCEVSKSLAWGTDTDDSFLKLAFPKRWQGENGYGQALMIARQLLMEKKG